MTKLRVVIEPTGDILFDKVQNKVLEVQDRLEGLGYEPFFITIKFTEFKEGMIECAGLANIDIGIIHINPVYLAKFEQKVLDEIVPHEVVHLYIREYLGEDVDDHGKEFMDMCNAIGVKAFEFHDIDL